MHLRSTLASLALLAAPLLALPSSSSTLSPLHRRQAGTGGLAIECPYTELAKKPKAQAHLHTQVTQNTVCAQNQCVTGKSTSHTFGIEASVGLDKIGVSGGVGIVNEWTSGEDHQCYGDPGDTVCVWLSTAYSVYDVSVGKGLSCSNDKLTIEAKFPHKNNAGGDYYCVQGEQFCRNINAHYWQNS